MLRHLHIKNLALIDDLEVSFDDGLNIITGETGAGKSLLMQAIELAVGGRAANELIRHEAQEAVVESVFVVADPQILHLLQESGYPLDEEILVRRVLSHNGRGRVYLNDTLATVALLRQVGERLLHIYGQHEQHTLLEAEAAIRLLDGFAGLGPHVAEMAARYHTLRQACARLQSLVHGKEAAQARQELLRFQLDEIKRASLRPGEEEAVRQEKTILLNTEKLSQGVTAGEAMLAAGEEAVTDRLRRLLARVRELARIDERLNEVLTLLSDGVAQIEEVALRLRRYGERLNANPERLDEIDARLTLLSRLKRKYGGNVEVILALQITWEQELQQLEGGAESLAALQHEVDTAATTAWTQAQTLSQARRTAAQTLETGMVKELATLGMKGARFSLRFHDDPEGASENEAGPFVRAARRLRETGCDRAEFFLSANPGEPLLPLVQVASGGELSRVMLALKALSAAAGEAPTLIFDEVDAGIGGAVAEAVGRRLKRLAAQRQVLCITHLPQIAAFADHTYTVVKTTHKGRTISSAKRLTANERIHELARMLGGADISAEARRHAREMLEGARRG